jgi:type VI protein secretion system component VasK
MGMAMNEIETENQDNIDAWQLGSEDAMNGREANPEQVPAHARESYTEGYEEYS